MPAPPEPRRDHGSLERGPMPLSRWAAGVAVGYAVAANLGWYALRTSDPALIRGRWTIPLVFTAGGIAFFAALCADHRIRPDRLHRETWGVALSSLLFVALLWAFGRRGAFALFFDTAASNDDLLPFAFVAAASLVTRSVLPLVTGAFAFGRGPADYGYALGRRGDIWAAYGALFLVVATFVVVASGRPEFRAAYPRIEVVTAGGLDLGRFALYHALYFVVFATGESLWRGYITLGLERELGVNATFFMIIPYSVVHFGKPQPEALGAIVAGLVLGRLAMAHGSFWGGALLHWLVALAMDLAVLGRRGVLG